MGNQNPGLVTSGQAISFLPVGQAVLLSHTLGLVACFQGYDPEKGKRQPWCLKQVSQLCRRILSLVEKVLTILSNASGRSSSF